MKTKIVAFLILFLFTFTVCWACYRYINRGILHPIGKLIQDEERKESWEKEISQWDKIRWLKKEQNRLLERIDHLEELSMSDWSYIESLEARIETLEKEKGNEKLYKCPACGDSFPIDTWHNCGDATYIK